MLLDNGNHTLQNGGGGGVVDIHIYVARTIFLLFYDDLMMTKTLNLSNFKYKWAYLNQYLAIHMYQKLYGKMISILYKMGAKYWGNSSYFCTLWWPRHGMGVIGNTKEHIWSNIYPYKHINNPIRHTYLSLKVEYEMR